MSVTESDFNYISKLVLDRSAIIIEEGKEYLVESRIGPIAKSEGFDDIENLVNALRNNSSNGLKNKVVEALITNETSFFRDVHPFEALKNNILPELLKQRKSQKQLNIWCGASSSGQEPYSIAMLIHDNYPMLLDWNLTFIASDLSREMLDRCRSGEFTQLEVNRGLPAPLLIHYFERNGLKWSIKKELREMINFQQINLAEPWPYLPKMDIILMRNVLIYFDVKMKIKILKQIKSILQPDGYLFLGAAESTLNLDNSFERIKFKNSGCYQFKKGKNYDDSM